MGKWIRCRTEQLQVRNSYKYVETPTPHDHVEFRSFVVLPSHHNQLSYSHPFASSSLVHPSSICLCCTYTHPPFSPRFQSVRSFFCLRSHVPYLHPSSSPGIPEHLPSSMYSVSVRAFILPNPCLLYSLTPPLLSWSPGSACFCPSSTFAILTPPFSPHLQEVRAFVLCPRSPYPTLSLLVSRSVSFRPSCMFAVLTPPFSPCLQAVRAFVLCPHPPPFLSRSPVYA